MAKRKPRKPDAPPQTIPGVPEDSVLHQTAPYIEEAKALKAQTLQTFNVDEVDRRLTLLSRFLIEDALRDDTGELKKKEKADLALATLRVIEGTKNRTDLFVEAPTGITADARIFEEELEANQDRLKNLLKTVKTRQIESTTAKKIKTIINE